MNEITKSFLSLLMVSTAFASSGWAMVTPDGDETVNLVRSNQRNKEAQTEYLACPLRLQAVQLMEARRFEGAISCLEQARASECKTPMDLATNYSDLGSVFRASKRPKKAIASYLRALEGEALPPQDIAKIQEILPPIYSEMGQHKDAIKWLGVLLKNPHYPNKAKAWGNLSVEYYNDGDTERAIQAARTTIRLTTDNDTRRAKCLLIGTIVLQDGRDQEAIDPLEKALAVPGALPHQRAAILGTLGQAHLNCRHYQAATTSLESAIGLNALPPAETSMLKGNLSLAKSAIGLNTSVQTMLQGTPAPAKEKKNESKAGPSQKGAKKKSKRKVPTVSNEQTVFKMKLKNAIAQANLRGDNWQAAEKGIAALKILMNDFNLTSEHRGQAKEAWLTACKAICVYYKNAKKYDRICGLFEGQEKELKGKGPLAKWCREAHEAAKKKKEKPATTSGKHRKDKEVIAPQTKKATNPLKARKNRSGSSSSSEGSEGPTPSTRNQMSETTKMLIRQDSSRIITKQAETENIDTQAALAYMIDTYGPEAARPALRALNKAVYQLNKVGTRTHKKSSHDQQKWKEYTVKMAHPDLESAVPDSCRQKFALILEELKTHPRTGRGKPETLTGDLEGCMSRRLNKQHRLVYSIGDDGVVTIHSVSGHY